MSFQDNPAAIRWRLHLRCPPAEVMKMLNSDVGRRRFWAESADEEAGQVHFRFPGGQRWRADIIVRSPRSFAIRYYGNSLASFDLADDGHGGTDLVLTDAGVALEDRTEVIAGWVSVLLALKAAVEYGVDLRNHDPERTWDNGYVEN